MSKPLILVASHLLCLGAGALGIRVAAEKDAQGGGMASAKAGERVEGRPSNSAAARRLADEALAAVKKAPLDSDAVNARVKAITAEQGEQRVRELAVALSSLGQAEIDEYAAAFLAWFREDRLSAITFLLNGGKDPIKQEVLKMALAELSPEEGLRLAASLAIPGNRVQVARMLGERLGEMDPAAVVALVKQARSGERGADLLRGIAQGWPTGRAQRYLDMALALGDGSSEALKVFVADYTNPRRASELLVVMKGREDLPPDFVTFLDEQRELIGHLYRYANPSVPLDLRIEEMRNLEWLHDATPEKLREGALKQISTVDINELMKSGPDYRYAFRHGAMSAEEVLDAVRKTFPELAAASDYETRVRVYNELASEDALAAFALISDLPDEQRNLAVIHQARWSFRDNSPETFYSMINLAPGPDTADAKSQREDAWTNYSESAYREYGGEYVEWLRALPAGVNREVARSSFAAVMREMNQKELAEEFASPLKSSK